MGAIDVDGNGSGYVSGGVTAAPGGLFPEYSPLWYGFPSSSSARINMHTTNYYFITVLNGYSSTYWSMHTTSVCIKPNG